MKHAEVITKEEEVQLWESGELGTKDPKALQNAVFYYNGKNFCLRGGVEHRELKVTQLERTFEPNGYIYHEYRIAGNFREVQIFAIFATHD